MTLKDLLKDLLKVGETTNNLLKRLNRTLIITNIINAITIFVMGTLVYITLTG